MHSSTKAPSASFWLGLTIIFNILAYPTVVYGYKLPDLGFLGWFSFVPLFYYLVEKKLTRIFSISFFVSFLFYAGNLYWIAYAIGSYGEIQWSSALGVLTLILVILSLFFSTSISLAYYLFRKCDVPLFLTLPISLVLADYLRTHFPVNGFSWAMIGYSQGEYLSLFQWVDITGIFGLNFFIYLLQGLLTEILIGIKVEHKDLVINRSILFILAISISIVFSLFVQNNVAEKFVKKERGVDIGLIQGNVAQSIKWDNLQSKSHIDQFMDLTEKASKEGAELAIWPETAYPYTVDTFYMDKHPLFLKNLLDMPILLGAVTQMPTITEADGMSIYNSALLLSENQQNMGIYHKRHLVPYGEYIPFKKYLKFAKRFTVAVGDFSPGDMAEPMSFDELKLGLLICYEDIFPQLARESVLKGANVLVNLTNDAWYGNTSAQYQHLVFSQMRALENRRYLLRSTNTGITALISPHGDIINRLPPFVNDYVIVKVYPYEGESFYTKYGDLIVWICLIGMGMIVFAGVKKRGRVAVTNVDQETQISPL